MTLESLILDVCELRNAYAQSFQCLSKQKDADFNANLNRLRDLELLSGAIHAFDKVIELAERDTSRRNNAAENDGKDAKDINALTKGMTLTKEDVECLHEQPCFSCKWSGIDPYDWGLRCCNGDSELCTEYCPDEVCGHYWPEVIE